MATIVDVAKKAGVSVATVSRVLNSNYIVTKEKRERVLKAMNELGYVPKPSTRNEKSDEKKVVMIYTSAIIEEVIAGIQDQGKQLGYEVIIKYSVNQSNDTHPWDFLKKDQLAGIIIFNMLFNDEELEELAKNVPFVQCCQYKTITNTFAVAVDDENGGYDVVSHLLKTGKKRIAFIGLGKEGEGFITPEYSKNRYIGYRRALEDNQIEFDPELVKFGDYSYDSGVTLAKELIGMKSPIDAVFCVIDNLALACVNTFKEAGFRIPEDVAICGFDNQEVSLMSNPKLTTVEQPFYEIGCESMKMLESMIRGESSTGRRLLLNHKLIERESTVGYENDVKAT